MDELKVFKNQEFGSVRTLVIDKEPWFVGKDVAAALGYRDTSDALKKHVDNDDKLTRRFADSGQNREMYIINESGLYSLILSSKLESAKRFKRWVTSEVLPAIRKNGAYLTDEKAYDITHNPDSLADLLLQAGEQLKQKDIVISEMKPKALFADAVTASETSILVRDFAKILKQNGVDTGEKRLYKWFRDNGFIIKNSTEPTQRAMEMGLFERIERTIQRSDKPPVVTSTTRITGKGQVYFTGKLLADN